MQVEICIDRGMQQEGKEQEEVRRKTKVKTNEGMDESSRSFRWLTSMLRVHSSIVRVDIWTGQAHNHSRGDRCKLKWQDILILMWFFSCLHMGTYLSLQYAHDWNDYQLDALISKQMLFNKLNESLRVNSSTRWAVANLIKKHNVSHNNTTFDKDAQQLLANAQLIDEVLYYFGGPHTQTPFLYEQIFFICILASTSVFFCPMMYYRLSKEGYNCNVVRDLFYHKEEREKMFKLIEQIIDEIYTSSVNFYQAKEAQISIRKYFQLDDSHYNDNDDYFASRQPWNNPLNSTNNNMQLSSGLIVNMNYEPTNVACCPLLFQSRLRRSAHYRHSRESRLFDHSSPNMESYGTVLNELRVQLDNLKHSQCLVQLNKTADWFNSRVREQFKLYTSNLGRNMTVAVTYLSFLFISNSKSGSDSDKSISANATSESRGILGNLIFVDLSVIVFVAVISSSYYEANIFIQTQDQIKFVKQLIEMVVVCEPTNLELFKNLLKSDSLQDNIRRDVNSDITNNNKNRLVRLKMNENILITIIHFRMFIAQLKNGVVKAFQIILSFVAISTLVPIIVRIHMPLLEDNSSTRNYVILTIMASAMPSDSSLIPLCHYTSLCLRLYKALAKLLAHSVQINEIYAMESNASIMNDGQDDNNEIDNNILTTSSDLVYHEHVIAMLRKELADMELSRRRFETRLVGFPCTYPTLCQAHFWHGLLFISSVLGNHTSNKQIMSILFFRV